jgi:hypothetical protein
LVLAVLLASSPVAAQDRVIFEQAAPVLKALPKNLPASLRGRSPQDVVRLWPTWVEQHDRDVRARLERGDDDSLVNFWLYGTSFTSHPPAIARASLAPASVLDDIVRARLEDLLDRVMTPGDNERLQFARRLLAARNADPALTGGRERARRFLLDTRQRMIQEFAGTERTLASARSGGNSAGGNGALTAANATIFHDRGLSSDTSVLSDFRVHAALETIARQGTSRPAACATSPSSARGWTSRTRPTATTAIRSRRFNPSR